jgi:hypothetical protein
MPTEPQPSTLAEVIRRAVDVCDPHGGNDASAELERRFEDRDEPITALADVDTEIHEAAGAVDPELEDPVVAMVVAVAVHLAFRRSELDLDGDELLVQAARSQYDGKPPEHVRAWLSERGVEA